MVGMYATKRAPSLATFLDEENVLARIRDQQRPRLVVSIATELKTKADVSNFGNVFFRVKETRDFVAHGTYMQRIDDDQIVIWNNYVTGPTVKRTGIKRRDCLEVTRDRLTTRLNDAR